MYILIVGGGEIGYYLARTLLNSGHRVGIVERDEKRCERIAEGLGITAYRDDGTDMEALREAGAAEAGYVVAVTGSDEENLVICQLARTHFRAPQTIARVNNPKNQAIFRALGVDATASTTALAAQMIENALPLGGVRIFSIFQEGEVEITEAELSEDSPVAGRRVAELRLPPDCVLIALLHEGRIVFPRGATEMRAGDRVYALAHRGAIEALKEVLIGGRR